MGLYSRTKPKKDLITEAYVGETEGIKEMQKHLSAFRAKYLGKFLKFDENINIDPDLEKFNRAVEKQFGFETFNLRIVSSTTINAFTLPVSSNFDVNTVVKPQDVLEPGKMKFKKDLGLLGLVWIFYGVLANPKFTDREVLAIILHEIGHNFEYVMNGYLGVLNTISNCLDAIVLLFVGLFAVILVRTNAYKKEINTADLNLRPTKFGYALRYLWKIKGIIDSITNETKYISKLVNPFVNLGSFITGILKRTAQQPTNVIFNLLLGYGYKAENLSDNFATMHGYGPEIASGLAKLHAVSSSQIENVVDEKIPILSQMLDFVGVPALALIHVVDPHPALPRRIQAQIEMLERELCKDSVDPKLRDRLLRDLKGVEIANDNYIKNSHKAFKELDKAAKEPHPYSNIYYEFLSRAFDGDLRHYIFDAAIRDEVDEHLNKK